MTEFFGSVWWLIVSLGILVTFHEFGHYWIARRFGVKVDVFSIGFFTLRWYSLAYIAGILIGWWYLLKLLAQPEITIAQALKLARIEVEKGAPAA